MKHKELKEALIGDKSYQVYKKLFPKWDKFHEYGIACDQYYDIMEGLDPLERKCLEQLRINEKRRKRKCRERLFRIIARYGNSDVFFLTLTFDDNTLSTTNEITRRSYITRFLKYHFEDYVANVDYGDENGREHYHAVVGGVQWLVKMEGNHNRLICPPERKWRYGFLDIDRVSVNSEKGLTEYLLKLTSHAVKRSTDPLSKRIIYARAF